MATNDPLSFMTHCPRCSICNPKALCLNPTCGAGFLEQSRVELLSSMIESRKYKKMNSYFHPFKMLLENCTFCVLDLSVVMFYFFASVWLNSSSETQVLSIKFHYLVYGINPNWTNDDGLNYEDVIVP